MKKIVLFLLILSITAGGYVLPISAAEPEFIRNMEALDRGLIAMQTSDGVYLNWRLLGTEAYETEFAVYRGNLKIATVSDSTNYTDTAGTAASQYSVAPIVNGTELEKCSFISPFSGGKNYFDIPLERPDDILLPVRYQDENNETQIEERTFSYHANDASCADLDGDGEYEIILKWEANPQDNSNGGVTGSVLIDGYKLDGTLLWRIDLGKNIREGAHYTQILAYDFDSDGIAEIALKTAPGSKDGSGAYVSEASTSNAILRTDNEADYRNGSGYILEGPEFFTVFDGKTGNALDTIFYPVPRGTVSDWGDGYGNRVDRFLGTVAYLDGVNPSIVTWRGYYTRTTVTAYNLQNKRLVKTAEFDSNITGDEYKGQGNHSLLAADVDQDGKDELISGALCLDDNLSVLWCSFRGHGDAHHIGDYDPTNNGLEYFSVHESGKYTSPNGTVNDYGMTVYNAADGTELFHQGASGDTGRGMMGNFGMGGYYQFWGAGAYQAVGGNTFESLNTAGGSNFRIFWDGDTYDELLDGRNTNAYMIISKYIDGTFQNIMTTNKIGGICNNYTKKTPTLQADILGDWREELILRLNDSSALRVYTTNIPTQHKLYTLMHDPLYRIGVATENVAYNQPPHIGYYLSEDKNDNRNVQPKINTVPVASIPTPEPEPTPESILFMNGDDYFAGEYVIGGSAVTDIIGSDTWTYEGYQYGYMAAGDLTHQSIKKSEGFSLKDGNFMMFAGNGGNATFRAKNATNGIAETGILTFDLSIPAVFSNDGKNARGGSDSKISIGDDTANVLDLSYSWETHTLSANETLLYQFEDAYDAQKWTNIFIEFDRRQCTAQIILTRPDGTQHETQLTTRKWTQLNELTIFTKGKWGAAAMDNLRLYETERKIENYITYDGEVVSAGIITSEPIDVYVAEYDTDGVLMNLCMETAAPENEFAETNIVYKKTDDQAVVTVFAWNRQQIPQIEAKSF